MRMLSTWAIKGKGNTTTTTFRDRLHPSIGQGQDQGGSSNAMPRQNLYENTSNLEETLTQFM